MNKRLNIVFDWILFVGLIGCEGGVEANPVLTVSSATVTTSNTLTLTCVYTPGAAPQAFVWVKDDVTLYTPWASACTKGQDTPTEYSDATCTVGPPYRVTLTTPALTTADNGQKWKCTVNDGTVNLLPSSTIQIKVRNDSMKCNGVDGTTCDVISGQTVRLTYIQETLTGGDWANSNSYISTCSTEGICDPSTKTLDYVTYTITAVSGSRAFHLDMTGFSPTSVTQYTWTSTGSVPVTYTLQYKDDSMKCDGVDGTTCDVTIGQTVRLTYIQETLVGGVWTQHTPISTCSSGGVCIPSTHTANEVSYTITADSGSREFHLDITWFSPTCDRQYNWTSAGSVPVTYTLKYNGTYLVLTPGSSVTVTAGSTVNLTCEYTPGEAPAAFTWWKDDSLFYTPWVKTCNEFDDIPLPGYSGATCTIGPPYTFTLTTPALTTQDSGQKWRCGVNIGCSTAILSNITNIVVKIEPESALECWQIACIVIGTIVVLNVAACIAYVIAVVKKFVQSVAFRELGSKKIAILVASGVFGLLLIPVSWYIIDPRIGNCVTPADDSNKRPVSDECIYRTEQCVSPSKVDC